MGLQGTLNRAAAVTSLAGGVCTGGATAIRSPVSWEKIVSVFESRQILQSTWDQINIFHAGMINLVVTGAYTQSIKRGVHSETIDVTDNVEVCGCACV